MSRATTGTAKEAEIAIEQRHIERVYARVSELRSQAEAMRDKGFALADGARNEADLEQGQMLLSRDIMVAHASKLLRSLDAEHEGLVFGRLDLVDGEVMYVGRLGIRDEDYDNLVTDWRAPASAAFYQATADQPMGVVRRRVIRSAHGVVTDIDDDLLMPDHLDGQLQVIGEGALMASMSRARGTQMHNIVATIQKEQDEAIRAPWQGITEITGGPGTGKTAVALHRAAYLLYRDRRRMAGSGLLVIGPSPVFTNYISRVLPSIGEDAAQLRSLGDVFDGVDVTRQDRSAVAAIKGAERMRKVLRGAVRLAPADAPTDLRITYKSQVLRLDERELAKIRRAVHARGGVPNASRVIAAEALLEALWGKASQIAEESGGSIRFDRGLFLDDLAERLDFHRFVVRFWILTSARETLTGLADSARLAQAAGKVLSRAEITLLAESFARIADVGFSVADVPLLDELRVLLGRPKPRKGQRGSRQPEYYDGYAHVVVDEAQDLSPMQWRMVGRRGQAASWTVVGDPVQSSWPDAREASEAMINALGKRAARRRFTLRTNYRNSAEIFATAAKVAERIASTDQLPIAVRTTGVEPELRTTSAPAADVRYAVSELLTAVDGTVGVITAMDRVPDARAWCADADERVRVVGSLDAKGLEYDAVVLFEPGELLAESVTGRRGLYVAITRATQRLIVLSADQTWLD